MNADAHFESFRRKVFENAHHEDAFPLGEFCRAWESARKEFIDELQTLGDVSWRQFAVYRELLFKEEGPLLDQEPSCLS